MGLDMYLERHKKAVEGYLGEDLDDMRMNNPKGYKFVEPYIIERGEYIKWKSLSEEVGYWRKANAIHRWFVDEVQGGVDDCDCYTVSKEQLEDLLDTCLRLKAGAEDPETLLPTQSGFFFGGTAYDEWYWQKIDYTIETLEKILKETDFDNEVITYQSSW